MMATVKFTVTKFRDALINFRHNLTRSFSTTITVNLTWTRAILMMWKVHQFLGILLT